MRISPSDYCGCWIPCRNQWGMAEKRYLPAVGQESHTTILASTSRTTLKQTFVNSNKESLKEVQYTFPLYDGVSVVGFRCEVAGIILEGVVKEKQQARTDYKEAVARGETAGLLEQLSEASDVFTTKIGNVPAQEKILVEITYLGELKHDAETDGSRFTVPTIIAPRYGSMSLESASTLSRSIADTQNGIKFLVDVSLDAGTVVRGLQSPSHPIAVTMGRTTSMAEDAFESNHASAELTLGTTELDKDFIVVVLSKDQGVPRAMLETHPTIPNQRALMATLVPKFNLPNITPEIVFVVDRSGSMHDKIPTLVSALKIFLKSLPVNGVKFNICSFGSHHDFLFKKSKTYDQSSLDEALQHVNTFSANYGGTEMLPAVQQTCKKRYNDMPLEVMILTDGQIWNQQTLFDFINDQKNARFFSLGIGDGASSALVEGIARAGRGFAQFVGDNEKMDKRVVRMLKGALTPHIDDYTLTVQYANESSDDDFEMVEASSEKTPVSHPDRALSESHNKDGTKKDGPITRLQKKTISLFDTSAKEEPTNPAGVSRFDNLPTIATPKVLQAPNCIPSLFAFQRTTVYLLLGPDAPQKIPKSVILRATSEHGPLELEIAVQDIGQGLSLHQLAAKKAVHELEEGRGWLTQIKSDGKLLKEKYEGRWDLMVERECVRLGTQFQVAGKYCSFVAVQKKSSAKEKGEDFEIVAERSKPPPYTPSHTMGFALSQNMGLAASQMAAAPTANPGGLSGGPPRSKKKSSGFGLFGSMGSPSFSRASPPPPPPVQQGALFGVSSTSSAYDPTIEDSYRISASPFDSQSPSGSGHGRGGFGGSSSTRDRDRKMDQSRRPQAIGDSQMAEARSAPPPAPAARSFIAMPARMSTAGAAPRKEFAAKRARKAAPSANSFVNMEAEKDEDEEEDEDMDLGLDADEGSQSQISPSKELSDEEKMHKIIDLQGFDGSWSGSEKLWELVGVDAVKSVEIAKGEDPKARATALAIAWLEIKMQKEEDTWEMVVEKARAYLENSLGAGKVQEVLEEAKKLVSA